MREALKDVKGKIKQVKPGFTIYQPRVFFDKNFSKQEIVHYTDPNFSSLEGIRNRVCCAESPDLTILADAPLLFLLFKDTLKYHCFNVRGYTKLIPITEVSQIILIRI